MIYLIIKEVIVLANPLLSFLPEYEGYCRVKILRLQEDTSLAQAMNVSLFHAITGSSPDYSIVAQKDAVQEILSSFDSLFEKNFGITMYELCSKHDDYLERRLSSQECSIVEQNQRLAQQDAALAARAQEICALQKKLDDTYNLLWNTRRRTLYGVCEFLWQKFFKK